ncbi:MAG: hypothetical protein PUC93_04645 [Oscillospiraceae bacterium]|nr:hypothetical protein [Oscillospiraceae bacterium]
MAYVEKERHECARISAEPDERTEKLQKIAAQNAGEDRDRPFVR